MNLKRSTRWKGPSMEARQAKFARLNFQLRIRRKNGRHRGRGRHGWRSWTRRAFNFRRKGGSSGFVSVRRTRSALWEQSRRETSVETLARFPSSFRFVPLSPGESRFIPRQTEKNVSSASKSFCRALCFTAPRSGDQGKRRFWPILRHPLFRCASRAFSVAPGACARASSQGKRKWLLVASHESHVLIDWKPPGTTRISLDDWVLSNGNNNVSFSDRVSRGSFPGYCRLWSLYHPFIAI